MAPRCTGEYLALLPDGGIWNCAGFANVGDLAPRFRFGNVFDLDADEEPLESAAARAMRRRPAQVPPDCRSCRHLKECGDGCMADAVLFGLGLGGKYSQCASVIRMYDWVDSLA